MSSSTGKLDEQADRAELARTQALLSVLGPMSATTSIEGIIAHTLSLRPKGISVHHITYTGGKQNSIVLNGTAQAREAVSAYQKSLQADPIFTGVAVPIEDLVGSGSSFSVTLMGNF